VAARPDQQSRLNLTINDPSVAGSLNTSDLSLLSTASATASQQVVVELAAADAVADNLTVTYIDPSLPNAADIESGYGLQDSCPAIFFRADLQHIEHGWCDPASTDLIPRKLAFVEDEHVQPRRSESPGTRRSCRSGADNQDIA
jgi:hypothetical protein